MNLYVEIAKKAVETFVLSNKIIDSPESLPGYLSKNKAGVFVSLYKIEDKSLLNYQISKISNKKLRGCIGTYQPVHDSIAAEIIHNAIDAASKDWRFPPISGEEIPFIYYSVYVLEHPKYIKDPKKELDPKKYGVLVRSSTGKQGLLLLDLEGIDTVKKQLTTVCQKCGILEGKEQVTICRFAAKKYE